MKSRDHLKEKAVFEMKMHDRLKLADGTQILKVPGGWAYTTFADDEVWDDNEERFVRKVCNVTSVFVPININLREGA